MKKKYFVLLFSCIISLCLVSCGKSKPTPEPIVEPMVSDTTYYDDEDEELETSTDGYGKHLDDLRKENDETNDIKSDVSRTNVEFDIDWGMLDADTYDETTITAIKSMIQYNLRKFNLNGKVTGLTCTLTDMLFEDDVTVLTFEFYGSDVECQVKVDSKGKVCGGTARDENEYRKKNQNLRSSETYFNSLFFNSDEAYNAVPRTSLDIMFNNGFIGTNIINGKDFLFINYDAETKSILAIKEDKVMIITIDDITSEVHTFAGSNLELDNIPKYVSYGKAPLSNSEYAFVTTYGTHDASKAYTNFVNASIIDYINNGHEDLRAVDCHVAYTKDIHKTTFTLITYKGSKNRTLALIDYTKNNEYWVYDLTDCDLLDEY